MVNRWLQHPTKPPEPVSATTGPPPPQYSAQSGQGQQWQGQQGAAVVGDSIEATVVTEADSNTDSEPRKMEEEEGSCDSVGVVMPASCDIKNSPHEELKMELSSESKKNEPSGQSGSEVNQCSSEDAGPSQMDGSNIQSSVAANEQQSLLGNVSDVAVSRGGTGANQGANEVSGTNSQLPTVPNTDSCNKQSVSGDVPDVVPMSCDSVGPASRTYSERPAGKTHDAKVESQEMGGESLDESHDLQVKSRWDEPKSREMKESLHDTSVESLEKEKSEPRDIEVESHDQLQVESHDFSASDMEVKPSHENQSHDTTKVEAPENESKSYDINVKSDSKEVESPELQPEKDFQMESHHLEAELHRVQVTKEAAELHELQSTLIVEVESHDTITESHRNRLPPCDKEAESHDIISQQVQSQQATANNVEVENAELMESSRDEGADSVDEGMIPSHDVKMVPGGSTDEQSAPQVEPQDGVVSQKERLNEQPASLAVGIGSDGEQFDNWTKPPTE
jgi:hypothetical protein